MDFCDEYISPHRLTVVYSLITVNRVDFYRDRAGLHNQITIINTCENTQNQIIDHLIFIK